MINREKLNQFQSILDEIVDYLVPNSGGFDDAFDVNYSVNLNFADRFIHRRIASECVRELNDVVRRYQKIDRGLVSERVSHIVGEKTIRRAGSTLEIVGEPGHIAAGVPFKLLLEAVQGTLDYELQVREGIEECQL